jgi:hypothetical protein
VQRVVVEGEASRALPLSGADRFPEYDWKRGRWEDTGEGKCAKGGADGAPWPRTDGEADKRREADGVHGAECLLRIKANGESACNAWRWHGRRTLIEICSVSSRRDGAAPSTRAESSVVYATPSASVCRLVGPGIYALNFIIRQDGGGECRGHEKQAGGADER